MMYSNDDPLSTFGRQRPQRTKRSQHPEPIYLSNTFWSSSTLDNAYPCIEKKMEDQKLEIMRRYFSDVEESCDDNESGIQDTDLIYGSYAASPPSIHEPIYSCFLGRNYNLSMIPSESELDDGKDSGCHSFQLADHLQHRQYAKYDPDDLAELTNFQKIETFFKSRFSECFILPILSKFKVSHFRPDSSDVEDVINHDKGILVCVMHKDHKCPKRFIAMSLYCCDPVTILPLWKGVFPFPPAHKGLKKKDFKSVGLKPGDASIFCQESKSLLAKVFTLTKQTTNDDNADSQLLCCELKMKALSPLSKSREKGHLSWRNCELIIGICTDQNTDQDVADFESRLLDAVTKIWETRRMSEKQRSKERHQFSEKHKVLIAKLTSNFGCISQPSSFQHLIQLRKENFPAAVDDALEGLHPGQEIFRFARIPHQL